MKDYYPLSNVNNLLLDTKYDMTMMLRYKNVLWEWMRYHEGSSNCSPPSDFSTNMVAEWYKMNKDFIKDHG